jgi:hypothetical protein
MAGFESFRGWANVKLMFGFEDPGAWVAVAVLIKAWARLTKLFLVMARGLRLPVIVAGCVALQARFRVVSCEHS